MIFLARNSSIREWRDEMPTMSLPALSTLWSLDASENESTSAPPPAERTSPAENDKRPFVNNSNANTLSVDGVEEVLRTGVILTITFPTAMVTPDKIDAEDLESPIDIWPSLDATFIWRTQSQGELSVRGPLIPGQSYRFRLKQEAQDVTGNPLQADDWGFEMVAPRCCASSKKAMASAAVLMRRPQIPLGFNYPVRLSDAASGVWFQDRASREKFPAEILLNVPEGEMANVAVLDAIGRHGGRNYRIACPAVEAASRRPPL